MVESVRNAPRTQKHEELLDHGDTLLRYALSRVGHLQTCEDLVQDTLVTAVSKLEDFAGRSSMRTWLIGILRHKILDHFRWNKRHPQAQPPPPSSGEGVDDEPWFTALGVWRADPNAGLEALGADPAAAVERSELRDALQRCIDGLSPALHEVYVLRELEGLEPDEVSEVASVARGSVAVMLYRARQALRACLQKSWGAA
jgi:RNA polymerase sigma-70 factor, ECF subfamily